MKRAPHTYDAWAIGRILEHPYVRFAPEILPALGVRVYWCVNLRLARLGVRVNAHLGVLGVLPRLVVYYP